MHVSVAWKQFIRQITVTLLASAVDKQRTRDYLAVYFGHFDGSAGHVGNISSIPTIVVDDSWLVFDGLSSCPTESDFKFAAIQCIFKDHHINRSVKCFPTLAGVVTLSISLLNGDVNLKAPVR